MVVHEHDGISPGQNRRPKNLAGMGHRFVQAAHAHDMIANQTQLGIEEHRHKVFLLRLVARVVRNDLIPKTEGGFGAIKRPLNGSVLVQGGFAHTVQNDSERKVLLRKGIAHAIFFQKRNDTSWSCPDARSSQGRSDSGVENGIKSAAVYAGFPESLDGRVRAADRDEPLRRARGEGWIAPRPEPAKDERGWNLQNECGLARCSLFRSLDSDSVPLSLPARFLVDYGNGIAATLERPARCGNSAAGGRHFVNFL